jgi:Holliday junction resolvasome RuvABC endonuclease subunit
MTGIEKILALDPATHCGWAHSSAGGGTWDFKVRRDESVAMRLHRLYAAINSLWKMHGVQLIAYEAARHAAPGMQGALVVQAEMQGVIKLWCEERQIPYVGYGPSEIKKFATGKGNAPKDQMILAAQAKWPQLKIVDDNHADALWILEYAKWRLENG